VPKSGAVSVLVDFMSALNHCGTYMQWQYTSDDVHQRGRLPPFVSTGGDTIQMSIRERERERERDRERE